MPQMQAVEKKRWVRDLLIIPLVVGVAVAIFGFTLPQVFSKKRQLSYSLDDPIAVLSNERLGPIDLRINGEQVSELYAYGVRLWNSGDEPLKAVPVLVEFHGQPDFKIYRVLHTTKPSREFGKIQEDPAKSTEKHFTYELLNPGDEDHVNILSNRRASLHFYAKAEGLRIKEQTAPKEQKLSSGIMGVSLSLVSALSALALKWRGDARRK